MKVRMSTTLVWYGVAYHTGDELDLPDDVATHYIAAGSAEPITPQVETTALHTSPPKGKRDVRNTASRT